MCPERRDDFLRFFSYMGPRPSKQHSLDRIDNSKGYEPGNVRWATRGEQNRNKRNNRWVTHNGKTMCMQDWVDTLGLKGPTVYGRISKALSPLEALGLVGRINKSRLKDEIGNRYGRLLVTGRAPNATKREAAWFCRCDCGREQIAVSGYSLRKGYTRSGGYLSAEMVPRRFAERRKQKLALFALNRPAMSPCEGISPGAD